MWQVIILPDAADELGRIPPPEQNAIDNALRKLEAFGPEATVDPKAFGRAVAAAVKRLTADGRNAP